MSTESRKKSTIVRAKNAAALRSVHTAFRVLEHTSPPLGARWAERLWLRVPPRAWRPRVPVAVPDGEPFALAVGASTVRGVAWGAGPVVYLLHGWGGNRGQLAAFVTPLVDAGLRVVAFDAAGHGASTPSFAGPGLSTLPDFTRALTAAVDRFGPAHAVVAHSFGTSAAVLAVLDGLEAGRLAAVAPMGDPIGFSKPFAEMLGFGERIRTGFLRRLERRVGQPMAVFDIPVRLAAEVAAGRALPPLFVLHDLKDREVPVRSGQDLARRWPGAVFRTTLGLGHNRILVDPGAVGQVVAFVTEGVAGPDESALDMGEVETAVAGVLAADSLLAG